MAAIRSIVKISDKWSTVTSTKSTYYEEGVRDPKKDWQEMAMAAEETYKNAVTTAANQGRYGKGVQKAGTAKWKDRALKKGPSRFSEGVLIAKPDYEAGFRPYAEEIAAVELPKRAPKGSRENIERVWAIAEALHKRKLAELGISS